MIKLTPESPHVKVFREVAADLDRQLKQLACLHQVDADGREYEVPMAPCWQNLPGRQGVRMFHVPHPDGNEGLFVGVFHVAPNSEYTGSHIAESRLVTVLAGQLECNERTYGPGQSLYIAPHEPTNWRVVAGATGATVYDAPPPDLVDQP